MKGYYYHDKGVFEVWLVREADNRPVAYTDSGYIIKTKYYTDEDKQALEDFEADYGL